MNNPKKKVIYFVPKECVEILKKIKVMYEQLDAMKTCGTDSEKTDHPTPLPMEFRGVEAGKPIRFRTANRSTFVYLQLITEYHPLGMLFLSVKKVD